MADAGEAVPGVSTPQVLKHFGIPPSTLSNWVKAGLCGPSILGSDGHRAVRYWSIKDVVTVRAIKELRDAGCPLRTVAQVAEVLSASWGATMSDSVLFWDGRDVLTVDTAGNVVSVIRRTGQSLLRQTVVQLTSFPVGEWTREVRELSSPVNVGDIRERRRVRRERYGRRPDDTARAAES